MIWPLVLWLARTVVSQATKTLTGQECDSCLNNGFNHCLISQSEGLCCDRDDPFCQTKALADSFGTKLCAEFIRYNKDHSYLTCPMSSECPDGTASVLDLTSYDKESGAFSYQWDSPDLSQDGANDIHVCKSTIKTELSDSIINLDFDEVGPQTRIILFIMTKGKFEYTNRKYSIEVDSLFKKFSINGAEDEFQYYVVPNSLTRAGSYKISTWLEKVERKEETKEEDSDDSSSSG